MAKIYQNSEYHFISNTELYLGQLNGVWYLFRVPDDDAAEDQIVTAEEVFEAVRNGLIIYEPAEDRWDNYASVYRQAAPVEDGDAIVYAQVDVFRGMSRVQAHSVEYLDVYSPVM